MSQMRGLTSLMSSINGEIHAGNTFKVLKLPTRGIPLEKLFFNIKIFFKLDVIRDTHHIRVIYPTMIDLKLLQCKLCVILI